MNRILDLIVDNFALPIIYAECKEEDIFKCKECGKSFKKVATFRKHRSNKHGPFTAPERYRPVIDQNQKNCPFCCKKYKSTVNLKKHIEKKHEGETIPFEVRSDSISDAESQGEASTADHACEICGKRYKRVGNLVKHIKDKHRGVDVDVSGDSDIINLPAVESDSCDENVVATDFLMRYTRNALALGLLAMNFNDARKNADGERLIRLYKVVFLLYR